MSDGRIISHSSIDRHCRTLRKIGKASSSRNPNGTVTFYRLLEFNYTAEETKRHADYRSEPETHPLAGLVQSSIF